MSDVYQGNGRELRGQFCRLTLPPAGWPSQSHTAYAEGLSRTSHRKEDTVTDERTRPIPDPDEEPADAVAPAEPIVPSPAVEPATGPPTLPPADPPAREIVEP